MLNKVSLIGRLGADPEVRHLDNGNDVANMRMATTEKWRDKNGERQERTEWHRVVVFGKLVEVIEKYVTKGDLIYIEGKLQTRKWQDQSGQDRYSTEVVLSGFNSVLTMLPSSGGGQGDNDKRQDKPEDRPERGASLAEDIDDEIPF